MMMRMREENITTMKHEVQWYQFYLIKELRRLSKR